MINIDSYFFGYSHTGLSEIGPRGSNFSLTAYFSPQLARTPESHYSFLSDHGRFTCWRIPAPSRPLFFHAELSKIGNQDIFSGFKTFFDKLQDDLDNIRRLIFCVSAFVGNRFYDMGFSESHAVSSSNFVNFSDERNIVKNIEYLQELEETAFDYNVYYCDRLIICYLLIFCNNLYALLNSIGKERPNFP